ncbi:probable LRR receptor-like serine/threonine-protein kinase At3g47570 [Daucus carota subsp. sativus]|uniref:probable LRR receptor-like serine/threonine-protein kinase At3g47570 n=1 Tax=Daucus carota subsp. sativus TaxID=79200 RepID=UPI0007F00F8E|nr:PREDICTED: probable LRR receptor-like serine/threonine-protein kinase At3g47570 [Daucus carota subsp. sativus]
MVFNFLPFNILFLFVLGTSTTFVYSFSNNVTDQQALLSFKYSITDDPSGVLDSWNNSIHFCHWTGVTCSRRRPRVTVLDLSSLNLAGTLSPHIGNLSFLRSIFLYRNNFHGWIPSEIGRLWRLQHISLGNNSFQGGFPANLLHCRDITYIDLDGNDLEGKLPTDFSSWSKLDSFGVTHNHIDGSIPPSIGNISSLRNLFLSDNNLAGAIPLEVAYLSKLEFLQLSANRLSGMVPLPLYNISTLISVSLANNVLKGTFPADLGFTQLPRLRQFSASNNIFTGPLPPSIANASNLVIFDMSINNITGPIPNNLGSLPNLEWLGLGRNTLGDTLRPNDWSFFNSLVNCTHLKSLVLAQSSLTGELPKSVANLSTTIENLYLHGNHIYGSIPHEIGKLVNMINLLLGDNFLTGSIPQSIGRLSKLGRLTMNGNNITGAIPNSISNITNLVVIYLDGNGLQGSIPTELFNISTLEVVSIANNRLGGKIPEEIGFFSRCLFLNLSQNLFSGEVPSSIGNLKHLNGLDLSSNRLTGDIPATLGGCVMLEVLIMDKNLFRDSIPSSFKALKSLLFLDLSNNNISGSIPSFFEGFRLIKFLNLSHNKLEGEVPKEGTFSKVDAFSVLGNLGLCGGIQALHLPPCHEKAPRNKKKALALRIILIPVLVPLGMFLACLALIYYRVRNSKKLNDLAPVLKNDQYPKLSYQDLLLATHEFSPNNLLGEGRYGSVYKGVLESVEHILAVKVLNIELRGANKAFLAECETLRHIRHRNLIKIITACSSSDYKGNDFKALVFEFMSNGSVDNWLHPNPSDQGNERTLTLLQRINISIDVALGLDYLHHHSHTSIIHSDIKPSNILLDNDFVAHIGDFGLARICFDATTSDINQAQTSSTGVRGTIGYVPPEYGMGAEISTEGDVYSYGIFLLEMFSGKRPTCSSALLDNDNNLHDYVRNALPQRVMNIVDPQIITDEEDHGLTTNHSYSKATLEVCLTSIFQVGILCSVEMPKERIDISVAIKQLHAARDKLLQHIQ